MENEAEIKLIVSFRLQSQHSKKWHFPLLDSGNRSLSPGWEKMPPSMPLKSGCITAKLRKRNGVSSDRAGHGRSTVGIQ
jgi:hypothetical protein